MPQIQFEPITIERDKYRHVFKTRAFVFVVSYIGLWPFGQLLGFVMGYSTTTRWLMMPVLALPMVIVLFAAIFGALRFAGLLALSMASRLPR